MWRIQYMRADNNKLSEVWRQLLPFEQLQGHCSVSIPFPHEGTPKMISHIQRNDYQWKWKHNGGSWCSKKTTPVLQTAGQKLRRHFERYLKFLRVYSNFYLLFLRFLADLLTIFRAALVGKRWSRKGLFKLPCGLNTGTWNSTNATKNKYTNNYTGPGYLSPFSDSLRAGRSEDQIPVAARFSAPVHTCPGAHPASYKMGTRSLSQG